MGLAAFRRMRQIYAQQKVQAKPPSKGFGVPINSVNPKSLAEMSTKELKELAKEKGLTGYSRKSEEELIEMLLPTLRDKAGEGNASTN